MRRVLNENFFNRPTLIVAKELIGTFLVRKIKDKEMSYMIVETEGYDGFSDKASHAHRGQTARNTPMFGKAGHWYVYFTYGMHWMLNMVTGPEKYPAAVLIRGALFEGQHINGPARLTKALQIDKRLNATPAARKSGLWVEDRGVNINPRDIQRTPRIGIRYAGPAWENKKYRFVLKTEKRKPEGFR